MARIYVASSWRNAYQPDVVKALEAAGHAVYDFRNPHNGVKGFSWSEIDPEWQTWSANQYRELLTTNPIAARGFVSDLRGMQWADTCVLVLPCGRSAHLEAGWFCGQGKRCIIMTRDGEEPELMALLATDICVSLAEVLDALDLGTMPITPTEDPAGPLPRALFEIADKPDFVESLQGYASFCETLARTGVDVADLELIAEKFKDCAFVVSQQQKLRDELRGQLAEKDAKIRRLKEYIASDAVDINEMTDGLKDQLAAANERIEELVLGREDAWRLSEAWRERALKAERSKLNPAKEGKADED